MKALFLLAGVVAKVVDGAQKTHIKKNAFGFEMITQNKFTTA